MRKLRYQYRLHSRGGRRLPTIARKPEWRTLHNCRTALEWVTAVEKVWITLEISMGKMLKSMNIGKFKEGTGSAVAIYAQDLTREAASKNGQQVYHCLEG